MNINDVSVSLIVPGEIWSHTNYRYIIISQPNHDVAYYNAKSARSTVRIRANTHERDIVNVSVSVDGSDIISITGNGQAIPSIVIQ